jgi:hypothetical protein
MPSGVSLRALAAGGFYIGRASSEANFPGSIVFSLIGYFLACYYFLQVGQYVGGGGGGAWHCRHSLIYIHMKPVSHSSGFCVS